MYEVGTLNDFQNLSRHTVSKRLPTPGLAYIARVAINYKQFSTLVSQ